MEQETEEPRGRVGGGTGWRTVEPHRAEMTADRSREKEAVEQ